MAQGSSSLFGLGQSRIAHAENAPLVLQYWHTKPPQEVQDLMDGWKSSSEEGFCYKLFDDPTALAFISDHFDERTRAAYLDCAVPAMKADLLRLCVLLIHPGIFVDADMRRHGTGGESIGVSLGHEPRASLMSLFEHLKRGLMLKKIFRDRPPRIANGFIVVKEPGDSLLRTMLETAVDNIERRTSNNVWKVTGPGIATDLFRKLGHEHDLFKEFEFWAYGELEPYLHNVSKLQYKLTEDHWLLAQAARSIFASR